MKNDVHEKDKGQWTMFYETKDDQCLGKEIHGKF